MNAAAQPTRADVDRLMKRCQIGVGGRRALDDAHDIMAECYGTLGRQQIEIDRLRAGISAAIKALDYHTEQTRPIGATEETIEALARMLKA